MKPQTSYLRQLPNTLSCKFCQVKTAGCRQFESQLNNRCSSGFLSPRPVFCSNGNIRDREWHVDKPIMWPASCHRQQYLHSHLCLRLGDFREPENTLTGDHTDSRLLENNNAVEKAYSMSCKSTDVHGEDCVWVRFYLCVCPELKEREWWCCNQARSQEGRQQCWQRVGTHLQSRISGPQSFCLAFKK